MAQFPKHVYPIIDPSDSKQTKDLLAYLTPEEAVRDDGPTVVATYMLLNTQELKKATVPVGPKKPK